MSNISTTNSSAPLLTNDGVPLKVSLHRSLRRTKIRSALLVSLPLLFLLIMFVNPIGSLLSRSIDDTSINKVFPLTFAEYERWDKVSEPTEEMYTALVTDIRNTHKMPDSEGRVLLGKSGTRMTYELSGWRSLLIKTVKATTKVDNKSTEENKPYLLEAPYKDKLIKVDKRWKKCRQEMLLLIRG